MWWKRTKQCSVDIIDRRECGPGEADQGLDNIKRERLSAQRGQTIVEAALEAGFDFPHRCLVGGCGRCRCRILEGRVKERTEFAYVLDEEEMEAGFVLGCQSEVRSDLTLELHPFKKRTKRRVAPMEETR